MSDVKESTVVINSFKGAELLIHVKLSNEFKLQRLGLWIARKLLWLTALVLDCSIKTITDDSNESD